MTISNNQIKWGVYLLGSDVFNKNPWCDWNPFSSSQRWSFNINDAFYIVEDLYNSGYRNTEVREYEGA